LKNSGALSNSGTSLIVAHPDEALEK
jgi:hypothetical protein